jgi:hypothetical protein
VPVNHDTEFRTEELPLAVFLCLEGHTFLRVERIDASPLKGLVFRLTSRLRDDVDCYESGMASVEPLAYQQKYYWLKRKVNPNGGRHARS